MNQKKIICESYQLIYDCVNVGENRVKEVGKRTVLPASFIGGPRDMGHRYMDVMALVQWFGKAIFLWSLHAILNGKK